MSDIVVSVIVPCYNQAQYLEECLESVLKQSLTKWECIIVNDGSTDNTEEVAISWTKKDKRFRYLKKENGGLSDARNYGINCAKAEYILPLDSDDKIAECYIEYCIRELEEDNNVCIVYTNANFFGAMEGKWNLRDFDRKNQLIENHIYCSGIYPKKDWQNVGGYDINIKSGFEDWEFWIRVLYFTGKTAKKINYEGFFYRRKDKGSMGDDLFYNRDKYIQTLAYIYDKHKELYIQHFGNYLEILKENFKLSNLNSDLLETRNKVEKLKKLLPNSVIKRITNKL